MNDTCRRRFDDLSPGTTVEIDHFVGDSRKMSFGIFDGLGKDAGGDGCVLLRGKDSIKTIDLIDIRELK